MRAWPLVWGVGQLPCLLHAHKEGRACLLGHIGFLFASVLFSSGMQAYLALRFRAMTRPSLPAASMELSDMQHSASTPESAARGFGPFLTNLMLCVLTCAAYSDMSHDTIMIKSHCMQSEYILRLSQSIRYGVTSVLSCPSYQQIHHMQSGGPLHHSLLPCAEDSSLVLCLAAISQLGGQGSC